MLTARIEETGVALCCNLVRVDHTARLIFQLETALSALAVGINPQWVQMIVNNVHRGSTTIC